MACRFAMRAHGSRPGCRPSRLQKRIAIVGPKRQVHRHIELGIMIGAPSQDAQKVGMRISARTRLHPVEHRAAREFVAKSDPAIAFHQNPTAQEASSSALQKNALAAALITFLGAGPGQQAISPKSDTTSPGKAFRRALIASATERGTASPSQDPPAIR
ncbi:MAG: hypothetical protein R3E42_11195 [Burkholderiaceae bacterium]